MARADQSAIRKSTRSQSSEPRKRRRLDPETRRTSILDAALRTLATAPFTEVSMADIAREAGASEALVFRYFNNKAELLSSVIAATSAKAIEQQRAAVDALGDTASRLEIAHAWIGAYFDTVRESPRAWMRQQVITDRDPADANSARDEARYESIGQLAELLSVEIASSNPYAIHGFMGFLTAACTEWAMRGCPADEREALTEAVMHVLRAALGPFEGDSG